MATRPASLRVRIGAAVAAVLLLAGLVLSFFAPGSNQATTTTALPTAPTTTISDADYERIAGGISTLIEQADAQRCPLISAFTAFGELPDPTNTAQVRIEIGVSTQLLRSVASSTAADEADIAATINDTAAALEAEAEEAGYAPSWIRSPTGTRSLASPEFVAAFEAYQQRTEQLCLPDGSGGKGPTPTPEPTEAPA